MILRPTYISMRVCVCVIANEFVDLSGIYVLRVHYQVLRVCVALSQPFPVLCRSVPVRQLGAFKPALPEGLWQVLRPLEVLLQHREIWTCSAKPAGAAKQRNRPRNLSPRTPFSPCMAPAPSHNSLHKVHPSPQSPTFLFLRE